MGHAQGTSLESKFRFASSCLLAFPKYRVPNILCGMKSIFVVISSAGPNRDRTKGTREQALWDEHAAFIDRLVSQGVIFMGGPLVDEGGSLLMFNAEDENEVRE